MCTFPAISGRLHLHSVDSQETKCIFFVTECRRRKSRFRGFVLKKCRTVAEMDLPKLALPEMRSPLSFAPENSSHAGPGSIDSSRAKQRLSDNSPPLT